MNVVWKNFPEPITSPTLLVSSQGSSGVGRGWEMNESEPVGFVENTQSFMGFISDWKAEGFWMAMYDKPFTEVAGEFLQEVARQTGIFILGNADLFFLMPAFIFMVGTFMIGRHKYTKWIIPLAFIYFVARIFFWMIR